jgi:hypothetical protein
MPAEGGDDRVVVVACRAVKGGKFASFTAAGVIGLWHENGVTYNRERNFVETAEGSSTYIPTPTQV